MVNQRHHDGVRPPTGALPRGRVRDGKQLGHTHTQTGIPTVLGLPPSTPPGAGSLLAYARSGRSGASPEAGCGTAEAWSEGAEGRVESSILAHYKPNRRDTRYKPKHSTKQSDGNQSGLSIGTKPRNDMKAGSKCTSQTKVLSTVLQ